MKKWKSFLRETLLSSVSYFVLSWLFFDKFGAKAVFEAIFIGVIAGLAWVTIMPRVFEAVMTPIAAKLAKTIAPPALEHDEELLRDEGANHLKGIERVGGKLALTNKRLVFRSHKINIQNHTEAIPIGQIASVKKDEGSPENVIRIDLKDGQKHFFTVVGGLSWIASISRQISQTPDDRG